MAWEGKGEKVATVVLHLEADRPSDVEAPAFDLEKAVCSHGLFMMSPNHWDPESKTLQRPLRLSADSPTLTVRVSHPHPRPSPLLVSVSGATFLSPTDQEILLAKVRRMLRLSEDENRAIRDFQKIHPDARERGFGRIFRSPTLFEDMVKCILLCNYGRELCRWLEHCEIQSELKTSGQSNVHLRTPQRQEPERKRLKKEKAVKNLEAKLVSEISISKNISYASDTSILTKRTISANHCSEGLCSSPADVGFCVTSYPLVRSQMGDFPYAEELAVLDEEFLAGVCGLGYRAKRILSLAQNVMKNKLCIEQLERLCDISNPSSYDTLNSQLLALDGFGPFTCANVLMCMGFYHMIPADTETIRHIKQFHGIRSDSKTVQRNAEKIYGRYAPFQFLAYWSEIWAFYEGRFGKLSEMPSSDYQLITATNMKFSKSAGRIVAST